MDIIQLFLLVGILVYLSRISSKISSSHGKESTGISEKVSGDESDLAKHDQKNNAADTVEDSSPIYQVEQNITPPISLQPNLQEERMDKVETVPKVEQHEEDVLYRFFAWLRQDWMVKAGAALLLIGLGWFVSFAFANNWVGPQGRITLGILAGVLILSIGFMRMRSHIDQGSIFTVLGSTTILLTIWAARTVYDFFTPSTALAVMLLSVAFVAFVSIKYQSQRLAIASVILAGIAPLLTSTPDQPIPVLFSYLFVVATGTLWVTIMTSWRYLQLCTLGIVFLYSVPYYTQPPHEDAGVALLFSFLFTGLFMLSSATVLISKPFLRSVYDQVIVGVAGLFLILWIYAVAPEHWESVLFAVWAIVYATAGYLIFYISKYKESFYIFSGVALVYIVAATVAAFDEETLVIALTLEAMLTPIMAYLITRRHLLLTNLSLLMAGPVFISFPSIIDSKWAFSVPIKEFAVLLVLTVSFIVLGSYVLHIFQQGHKENKKALFGMVDTGIAHLIAGGVYGLVLIWLVSHGALYDNYDLGTLVSLIIYTILGILLYVVGHLKEWAKLRLAGAILVGGVILRLLFADVWDMEVSLRIVTFTVIGILLLGTAFIEKKNKIHD
jgi:uncharacterized membrane protein